MARDYAKKKQNSGSRKKTSARSSGSKSSAAKSNNKSGTGGLRIYIAGFLSGIAVSFLAYLTTVPDNGAPSPIPREETQASGETRSENPPPRPRFEFPTRLEEQTFDVEERAPIIDPAPDVSKPVAPADMYVLQAGAFRQREDAERRRAELLLLDLKPHVEASSAENGGLHRVYLGPYKTTGEASRARSLTANEGIETMLLKRPSS